MTFTLNSEYSSTDIEWKLVSINASFIEYLSGLDSSQENSKATD